MPKHGPTPKTLDIARVESVAAMGGTNDQIAEALGVAKRTLDAIRKRQPEVDEAVQRGKDKADLQVVAALYKKAMAGDTTAMIFWLKNRRREEWGDRYDVAHSGKIDSALTIKVVQVKDGNGNGNTGI
jgi:hypothetical protein